MHRESIRPYVWMLMGCASFTVMYELVHFLREACSWQIIALVRTGLACFFALFLARAAGAKLVFLRPPSLWIRSLAGSISLMCAFFAMTRNVPTSNVLAITNMFPIWIPLFAWPALGTKPSWQVITAVIAAVAGVFLIRSSEVNGEDLSRDASESTLATSFALAASMFTAVAMLGLNRLHWIDSRSVVAHFSGVAMVFCFAALVLSGNGDALDGLSEPKTLLMLLGVGITATAGQIWLTKAFTVGAPAKVAVVALVQVAMTLVVDVCFFGELFSSMNVLGMGLIVLPAAWVVGRRASGVRGVDSA